MVRPSLFASLILVLFLECLCTACGASHNEIQNRAALAELNLYHFSFSAIFGRGPKDADEFKRYVEENVTSNGQPVKLNPRIFSGDIVVNWNGDSTDESQKNAIVAYEKQVPTKGGYVALRIGETVKITAQEFSIRAMLKPKKPEDNAPANSPEPETK